jgi:hypothetical protein
LLLAICCCCRYFCRQRYLVVIDILSPSIFCRRQYFVAVNILSPSIFCHHQNFCNFCNSIIVFCVYDNYY